MTEIKHAKAAGLFIADEQRANWHSDTLWLVRQKRDRAVREVPEWEELRNMASAIKDHTLSRLDDYLLEFEQKAVSNDITVHWAADAAEHNEIILEIIRGAGGKKVIKSKSMLTEECHLNDYLRMQGVEVLDTDLGEYIVQLRKEMPSHIVLPAVHLKKEEVSETFHKELGTDIEIADPNYLVTAARWHLRDRFIESEIAITGVNFAIAETGGLVICTNEGNADLGVHAARVHIACMGIEKIIPKAMHLGLFLRLLARSATGQRITTYSSHFHRPRKGQQMHVVIVDNGRTRQLSAPDFRNSLKCIRCGACFNTCPVYRYSGGHSYHSSIAGPIGSILAPNFDRSRNADLPFASSLCGSCTNVCPVKIDIHNQLWKWRQVLMKEGHGGVGKKTAMGMISFILSRPFFYSVMGRTGRMMLRLFPSVFRSKRFNPWYRQREMPAAPSKSFREWYKNKRR